MLQLAQTLVALWVTSKTRNSLKLNVIQIQSSLQSYVITVRSCLCHITLILRPRYSILEVVHQNFQAFWIDKLLILDEHFLQICELQSFGEEKVQKTDNCHHQMDYERY